MIPPVPILEEYGISPRYGFLPMEFPLEVLPDPYYSRWEAISANLQALLLSRRLRGVIQGLPVLSTSRLQHPAEWRRAYMLLAFVTHAYIWGGERPEEVRNHTTFIRVRANRRLREYHQLLRSRSSRYAIISSYLLSRHTLAFAYGISSPSLSMSPWTLWKIYLHS